MLQCNVLTGQMQRFPNASLLGICTKIEAVLTDGLDTPVGTEIESRDLPSTLAFGDRCIWPVSTLCRKAAYRSYCVCPFGPHSQALFHLHSFELPPTSGSTLTPISSTNAALVHQTGTSLYIARSMQA